MEAGSLSGSDYMKGMHALRLRQNRQQDSRPGRPLGGRMREEVGRGWYRECGVGGGNLETEMERSCEQRFCFINFDTIRLF